MTKEHYYYLSVQEKLDWYAKLIKLRDHDKLSYAKIGKMFEISEKRVRDCIAEARKVAVWNKTSSLWRAICNKVPNEPSSYAIRMFGILKSSGVYTINDLLKTPLEDIKGFYGIGVKYYKTLSSIRADEIEKLDTRITKESR